MIPYHLNPKYFVSHGRKFASIHLFLILSPSSTRMKKQILLLTTLLTAAQCLHASDSFVAAQRLFINTTTSVSNASATNEAGEPVDTGYKTLWYRYIAPTRGVVRISTPVDVPIGIGHQVGVYRGNNLSALNWVTSNETSSSSGGTTVTFLAEAGMEFRILISSYYSGESGILKFSIQQDSWPHGSGTLVSPAMPITSTPRNDEFASAAVIPSQQGSVTVFEYASAATSQNFGPEPTLTGYKSLWYRWVAPTRGLARFRTPSSPTNPFGHNLSVFRGNDLGRLNTVMYDSTSSSNGYLDFTFPVEAGMEFRIAIGNYYNSDNGTVVFSVQTDAWPYGAGLVAVPAIPISPVPLNDDFRTPAVIPSVAALPVTTIGYQIDATGQIEGPEPDLVGYKSLWYKWTAPKRGIARLSTPAIETLGFGHRICVFRGNSLSAVNTIHYDYTTSSNGTLSLEFPVEAGLEYRISVASHYTDQFGIFVMTIGMSDWPYGLGEIVKPSLPFSSLPRNDEFQGATLLPNSPARRFVLDSNINATTSTGSLEPDKTGYQTLWYRWTAPSNTAVRIETSKSRPVGFRHSCTAFRGAPNQASQVARAEAADDSGLVMGFEAIKGNTYYLCFASSSELGASFVFSYLSGPLANPTAPVVKFTNIKSGAVVSKTGFNLECEANDPEGIRQYELILNGKLLKKFEPESPFFGSSTRITIIPKPRKAGRYVIKLRAQDLFGRWGSYKTITIKLR